MYGLKYIEVYVMHQRMLRANVSTRTNVSTRLFRTIMSTRSCQCVYPNQYVYQSCQYVYPFFMVDGENPNGESRNGENRNGEKPNRRKSQSEKIPIGENPNIIKMLICSNYNIF